MCGISLPVTMEAINLSINFWFITPLVFPSMAPVIHPALEALFNIVRLPTFVRLPFSLSNATSGPCNDSVALLDPLSNQAMHAGRGVGSSLRRIFGRWAWTASAHAAIHGRDRYGSSAFMHGHPLTREGSASITARHFQPVSTNT